MHICGWYVHQALARVYLYGSYAADGMSYKKCNDVPLLCFWNYKRNTYKTLWTIESPYWSNAGLGSSRQDFGRRRCISNFGWIRWILFYYPERGPQLNMATNIWFLSSKGQGCCDQPTSTRMSFKSCQTQESKYIEIVGFTEEDRVKYAESIFSSQHNREDNDVHPITLCDCSSDL